jgi:putative DNA primase/helicase
MNETSQGSRFDEAKLKDLTGSDSLTGRFLREEFFDFRPTHKLVIRGNHKPAIIGTDEGIWRRLRLVPFTVSIPADEQDRHLLEKLRAELPGILKWAVDGCLEWQRCGLMPPDCVTEAVKAYRSEADTLGRFIEERCEVRKLAQVQSSTFFSRYQDFCVAAGERALPAKDLPMEMARRGFEHKRTNASRVYLGIEFTTSGESDWRTA